MSKPDWDRWLRLDLWTLRQATFLSLDIEPGSTPTQPEVLTEEYIFREQLALTSQRSGNLRTLNDTELCKSQKEVYYKLVGNYWSDSRSFPERAEYRKTRCSKTDSNAIKETIVNSQHTNIFPIEYIVWATNKEISLPNEMRNLVGMLEDTDPTIISDTDKKRLQAAYLRSIGKTNGDIADELFPEHASSRKNQKSMAGRLAREGIELFLAGKAASKAND